VKGKTPSFQTWVIWTLRKASYRWPARSAAFRKAAATFREFKTDWGIDPKDVSARVRNFYWCKLCGFVFPRKLVSADHVDPVIEPAVGFVDWNTYIPRMFCATEGFNILCKDCHDKKTKIETGVRAKHRNGAYSQKANTARSKKQEGKQHALGTHWSEQSRANASVARKGLPQTRARRRVLTQMHVRSRRPVRGTNVLTGAIRHFHSATQASQQLKITASNISRVCNFDQRRTQAGGWKFTYAK